ncbi:MAG: hypothetical protein KME22_14730 [Hassallia sp. WJT32-NPBG1]|nr:hypothetical protein [Hassallia sp. WJT32-NPBG1]
MIHSSIGCLYHHSSSENWVETPSPDGSNLRLKPRTAIVGVSLPRRAIAKSSAYLTCPAPWAGLPASSAPSVFMSRLGDRLMP